MTDTDVTPVAVFSETAISLPESTQTIDTGMVAVSVVAGNKTDSDDNPSDLSDSNRLRTRPDH